MTATSAPKQAPEEQLTRMSFGEHLEELRSRIFKALGAVLLGVVVLFPFKHAVTEIYIAPYRKCWFMHYEKYLAKLDEMIGLDKPFASLTPAESAKIEANIAKLHDQWKKRVEFHRKYRDDILGRSKKAYPRELMADLENEGGFPLSYNLKATGGLDDIWIFMSATMLFGVILASPVVIWQIWAFIAAGLYQKERSVVWTYLPFGTALLAAGVLFGYYAAVPYGYYMLVSYMEFDQVGPLFNVSHYFSFFFSFCTALGLVFQLPLVMLVVNKIGLVSHAAMRKSWRYVILGICFVSMVVTPPDPFSMILMATPMVLLYLLGLVLTAIVERKKLPAALCPRHDMTARGNAIAEIVAIGDELLHGRIVDTNSPAISTALEQAGLRMRAVSIVGDDLGEACQTLDLACRRSDVVVVTGGLGPTADDRTREAVARVAGVPLEHDPESWRQIDAFIRSRGRVPSESNRIQAEFPRGAEPLENRWGTAPGFEIRIGRARLFALPGVPSEMQAMLGHHVVPRVLAAFGGSALVIHELHLIGATEAAIGERIARHLADGYVPRVGINAHFATYTVRIAAEGASEAAARADAERVAAELRALLGDLVVYEGNERVNEHALRLCAERGLTLALAESCTGGLLGAMLTDVPGSSAVLKAGYVAYENAAKTRDLAVPEPLLLAHGAVSVEVAAAMAEGAMRRAETTLGIAITGVAGPGGGSEEKPVGTVCFGLARSGVPTEAWRKRITALGRKFIREHAAHEALFALVRRLRALPVG